MDMAHIAHELCHIVRGISQFQHRLADDFSSALRAELAGVGGGRDDGELFDKVPGPRISGCR